MPSFFAIASIESCCTLVWRFFASNATVSQKSRGHLSVTCLNGFCFAVMMSFRCAAVSIMQFCCHAVNSNFS